MEFLTSRGAVEQMCRLACIAAAVDQEVERSLVGSVIPDPCSQRAEVSSGKTLNLRKGSGVKTAMPNDIRWIIRSDYQMIR